MTLHRKYGRTVTLYEFYKYLNMKCKCMYPFNSTLKGKYQNPQKKLICFSAFGIQKTLNEIDINNTYTMCAYECIIERRIVNIFALSNVQSHLR